MQFKHPPILIGGKAMQFYKLRLVNPDENKLDCWKDDLALYWGDEKWKVRNSMSRDEYFIYLHEYGSALLL